MNDINEQEKREVKPFYIDAEKHNLTEEEADTLLEKCRDYCVTVEGVYSSNLTTYNNPCFGVMFNLSDRLETFVCVEDDVEGETEISPEDLSSWLSHGLTKKDYIKESMETLAIMQGDEVEIETTPTVKVNIKFSGKQHLSKDFDKPLFVAPAKQKPTLGLQTHSTWVQLRQYEIVKALHHQVEDNADLNEDWIKELVELMGEYCE